MISHQINSNNIYSALKQITMKVNIIELPKLMLAGLVTIGVMGFSSLEAEASCPTYDLRSASSNVKRALTIVNKVHDRSANLYWIDFNGQKKHYATIPPFGKYEQSTYHDHVWVVENTYGYCDTVFIMKNNVEIQIK